MKRIALSLICVALCSVVAMAAKPMTVTRQGENIVIATSHDGTHYEYAFERCMANRLYTFATVKVNGTIVNQATSDNIGPLLVAGAGWTGGNHLLDGDVPSAITLDVVCSADGKAMTRDKTYKCSRVDVVVNNSLKDPRNPAETLCLEIVTYTIMGNTIEVSTTLHFERSCVVERYYGMQSMMVGEKALYTPGGAYDSFVAIDQVDRFATGDYPQFNCFVEQSNVCHQACYLAGEGLGARTLVARDDYAFIGNSSGKCYHKVMGNARVEAGECYSWHGAYVWFENNYTLRGNYAFAGYWQGRATAFECNQQGCTPLITTNKR